MHLPSSRGPASELIFDCLTRPAREGFPSLPIPEDPWSDDFQILLWVLQRTAYRPFDDVDIDWEREPHLRDLRNRMEFAYEAQLRRRVAFHRSPGESVVDSVRRLTTDDDGPSLSEWMAEHGTLEQLRELVVHRAAYQLQEADPHSFAIPRLEAGRAKRALLKIQLDEYGNTEPNESHAELFRQTMDMLGVECDIDALPAATLRTNTLLHMLASSRRLLGGCIGHLAVFETCSVEPMACYASAVRRLLPDDVASTAARFYDVHVAADGWHQDLAMSEMVDGFVGQYPAEADEVLFGAAALILLEREFSAAVLTAWQGGHSSLRQPTPRSTAAA